MSPSAQSQSAASSRPQVLLVSKPVAPPWNDSGKNLARDLARHGRRFAYRVLTVPGFEPEGADVIAEPIYRDEGRHAPALSANLRVMSRLMQREEAAVRHFLFSPNPRTSWAARLTGLFRRVPSVLTVVSFPRRDRGLASVCFGRRVVTLSEHSRRRLAAAGVSESRLRTIPPGVDLPSLPGPEERRRAPDRRGLDTAPIVLFAGDYEFSSGAHTLASAIPTVLAQGAATFVLACRPKTEAAAYEEAHVRERLSGSAARERVHFEGQVDDILDLVAASALCVMPSESVYAKSDLPLVLLEALARGVPLVVADVDPLREVIKGDNGLLVRPRDPDALGRAIVALLGDTDRLGRMAQAARQSAEQHFDVRRMCREYEDVYAEVAS